MKPVHTENSEQVRRNFWFFRECKIGTFTISQSPKYYLLITIFYAEELQSLIVTIYQQQKC